ncbi:MAG: serine acetyltransferase [Firmicutes bacterium]|nr:serine acetyltransferase [Bacillota bacterium]
MKHLEEIKTKLDRLGKESGLKATESGDPIPSRVEIRYLVMDILSVLFPNYFAPKKDASLSLIEARLARQIAMACHFSDHEVSLDPEDTAREFVEQLPEIKRLLLTDIEALYEGDPAAKIRDEVIICYPGFYAIAVYRMAHVLYEMGVPLLYRMMTEYAHERTGVDIHAGAKIGEYFFIDHGTGIVIGETTTIGDHVKLYQGVTLGAKSFELDENGNPIKNIKRHPNIGNNVVIYANATILGGRTFIGDNSIIGASTWIIESVPEGSRVFYSADTAKAMEFWGDYGSGI